MKTWHIHISGLVQGVGFRPHVYRLAEEKGITGNICNSKDGVHIIFNADESSAEEFYNTILRYPLPNAVITNHHFEQEPFQAFDSFSIVEDTSDREPDLLLTPDFAICDNCRQEIKTTDNKRYNYAFTTCLHCGPRYSILKALPYERHNTSMAELSLCKDCLSEYNEVHNRRYYSQTNSCPDCAIPMHLYNNQGKLLSSDSDSILEQFNNILEGGMIAAVKGIGGYLLLCDATNENAILTLRENKYRPAKPFALLYDSVDKARQDVFISINEEALLKDKSGPIVLCKLQPIQANKICKELIAPGLDKIGLMLPCSPLLQLITSAFKKPLIATSANINGSPIIYKDEDAIESLRDIADFFLSYDREIMLPQDDSVMQLSEVDEKIILRRSRGLAPNYFPSPFEAVDTCVFATGGELKSAFVLQCKDRIYISQFLGNQETLASQNAYRHTFEHLSQLLQIKPSLMLADKHPEYHVTRFAQEMALTEDLPLIKVQHHKAHFAAVLAENNLLKTEDPVLGIIWDGTGYGDDDQIWGGEFFIYDDGEMQRVAHLDYFPQLLGDKMNREPRLSALSLLRNIPAAQQQLQKNFSEKEWNYYQQLIKKPAELLTSSMGKFLDGIASILNICQINSYEGEAAMKMEAVARSYTDSLDDYYPLVQRSNRLDHSFLLQEILNDLKNEIPVNQIARKVFYSLAKSISLISESYCIDHLAFSGGVFQNALLTDMIIKLLAEEKQLYRHRELSPNDECIGFGQLAYYHILQKRKSFLKNHESIFYDE